jgi:hypothetical protein
MKRFLMLLGVAAIAGAMYVAAAPGSALHAGPTWKQYSGLVKQVAALKKQVAQVKKTAVDADAFIHGCFTTNNAGVAPVTLAGDVADLGTGSPQTYGYEYDSTPGATETGPLTFSTAINVDTSQTPQFFVQFVDPACVTGGAAPRAVGRLTHGAEHTR